MKRFGTHILVLLFGALWLSAGYAIADQSRHVIQQQSCENSFVPQKWRHVERLSEANRHYETGIRPSTGSTPVQSLEKLQTSPGASAAAVHKITPYTPGHTAYLLLTDRYNPLSARGRSADYYVLALRRLII